MPTVKKKSKKTPVKSAPVKRSKRSPAKKRTAKTPVSFKVSKESTPFMTFRFTRDTLYWTILLGLILALGTWVLTIQMELSRIIDSIG